MCRPPNRETHFGRQCTVLPRLPSLRIEEHLSATDLFERNDCIIHQLLSDVIFATCSEAQGKRLEKGIRNMCQALDKKGKSPHVEKAFSTF